MFKVQAELVYDDKYQNNGYLRVIGIIWKGVCELPGVVDICNFLTGGVD